jgi:hypothetical protein
MLSVGSLGVPRRNSFLLLASNLYATSFSNLFVCNISIAKANSILYLGHVDGLRLDGRRSSATPESVRIAMRKPAMVVAGYCGVTTDKRCSVAGEHRDAKFVDPCILQVGVLLPAPAVILLEHFDTARAGS